MTAFLSYTCYVGFKYGVTESISKSVYVLPKNQKPLFSFFIMFIAIPMMLVSDTVLGWWAGAILMFNFAAPLCDDKMQNKIHIITATGGMIMGMLMIGLDYGQWGIFGITIAAMIFTYLNAKNFIWWIECEVLLAVCIVLMMERIIPYI